MPSIGNHVSGKRKDLKKTIDACPFPVAQFYTGGRQTYNRTEIKDDLGRKLFDLGYETGMFIHGCLNVNLARPPSGDLGSKGYRSLLTDLKSAKKIGGCLVSHIGSHLNQFSLDSVCENLGKLSLEDEHEFYKPLLLENSSGNKRTGTKLGCNWEELEYLANNLSDKIGFCIDTQHSFAAGLCKFETVDQVNQFYKDLDNKIGLDRIKLFHLNDSEIDFDGKVDRHASIISDGRSVNYDSLPFLPKCVYRETKIFDSGKIWDNMNEERKGKAFKHFLLRAAEHKIPLITETPNAQDPVYCYEFLIS